MAESAAKTPSPASTTQAAASKAGATQADATQAKPAAAAKPAPQAKAAANGTNGAAAAKQQPQQQQTRAAAAPATQQQTQQQYTSVLDEFEELQSSGAMTMRQIIPSTAVSVVVHAIALIIMGLITSEGQVKETTRDLTAAVSEDPGDSLNAVDDAVPLDVEPQNMELPVNVDPTPVVTDSALPVMDAANFSAAALDNVGAPFDAAGFAGKVGGGSTAATSLSGSRGDAGRKAAVAARGGNDASEAAVARALQWLAEHQMPDGGFSMDAGSCPKCGGKCGNPGTRAAARMGGTALGVLPFLGAGQTHKQGKYKANVQAALAYIVSHMKVTPEGGNCMDAGSMYSHGLCAIALCESYALSQDKSLAAPAQLAMNFISAAQDPVGGGWRYAVRQPGDTSVVGWQLMALKSGHLSALSVPPQTIKKAIAFLDAVQDDGGAYYGYTDKGRGPATSAVGLLCRMYLGWKREEPALERGVKALAKRGPSPSDMYFNYYATQVLHQYEGELWSAWNEKMRDQLINTQSKNGHETGSWYYPGGHTNEAGGRLCVTSLCTMTLEVYYRHMPLYKKTATDDDF